LNTSTRHMKGRVCASSGPLACTTGRVRSNTWKSESTHSVATLRLIWGLAQASDGRPSPKARQRTSRRTSRCHRRNTGRRRPIWSLDERRTDKALETVYTPGYCSSANSINIGAFIRALLPNIKERYYAITSYQRIDSIRRGISAEITAYRTHESSEAEATQKSVRKVSGILFGYPGN